MKQNGLVSTYWLDNTRFLLFLFLQRARALLSLQKYQIILKKFGFIVAYVLLTLVVAGVLFLNSSGFQKAVVGGFIRDFNRRTHTTLSIERMSVDPYHGVQLHVVRIEEASGKPILRAERADVGLRILPLLHRELRADYLRLVRATVYLRRARPKAPLNIQPILDAYASKGKQTSRPWRINLSTVVLRECRLHYDVESAPYNADRLDSNHLDLMGVSTKLSVKYVPGNSIRLTCSKLQGEEKCGLRVDQCRINARLTRTTVELSECYLRTRSSELVVNNLKGNYKDYDAWKHPLEAIQLFPTALHARIQPSEFAVLWPALGSIHKVLSADMVVRKERQHLLLNDFRAEMEGGLFRLEGDIDLDRLHTPSDLRVTGSVRDMHLSTSALTALTGKAIPSKWAFLTKLGSIDYQGDLSYSAKSGSLKGNLTTLAGELNTDIQVQQLNGLLNFSGTLRTSALRCNAFLPASIPLGETNFDVNVKGNYSRSTGVRGTITGSSEHVVYKGYDFKNLNIDGEFDRNGFEGTAQMGDINGNLLFSGKIDVGNEHPVYHFDLFAHGFNPFAFGLLGYQSNDNFSFHLHTDATGSSLDNLTGKASIDSLRLKSGDESFFLRSLTLELSKESDNQRIRIASSVLNADVSGHFRLKDLPRCIQNALHNSVPSLVQASYSSQTDAQLNLNATLTPCPELFRILKLPITLNAPAELQGMLNEETGKYRIKADLPDFNYQKTNFQTAGLLFENPQKEAKLLAYGQFGTEENPIKFNLDARGSNDVASCRFILSNSGVHTYSGNIAGDVHFARKTDGSLMLDGQLKASTLIVNDSIWNIHPTEVHWENKALHIFDFQLTHAHQFIKLQGIASANPADTLHISLNAFSLDNVFDLLKGSVRLGGEVTGNAKCSEVFGNTSLNADLNVDRFSFNNVLLGNLDAKSMWDTRLKALVLDATVHTVESDTQTRLLAAGKGYYFPGRDSLFLSVDGHRLPLEFLEPYLGTILKHIDGEASGNVVIKGPMKRLGVYTNAYVENGSFGIGMLNTRYTFSDSIRVTPNVVSFSNTRIRDEEGNYGIANGIIRHNYFKNSNISIEITGNNILCMNLPADPNAYFYGKAYGSGNVSITGTDKAINIDVGLRTENNTDVTISFLQDKEVADAGFVQFEKPKNVYEPEEVVSFRKSKKKALTANTTAANITVNLDIEATPNADLTLITDPSTGDNIKAKGNGNIRCVFSGSQDLSLFGRYNILSGKYKFVYENLLRMDFSIDNGGSINFSGNPFTAQVDISANYLVNAQLADLLSTEDLNSLNLNRTSIPVNCVLRLSGELQRPGITLDLAYPSADDELKRRINNVINTEDMRNQQLVFLMLFGRFSTPTYSTAQGTTGNSMSTVLNTGISTLSSQFNRMVNGVLGDKMNFNFNYKNSTYNTTTPGEWGVMMSGSFFNNRLSINSNVGSRENLIQGGGNQFIGEFDGNLKFKNSEKWSWKFFNRANDNRYFKSALNTQGVGILYREDFNRFLNLFRRRKNTSDTLTAPKK
jgi:hypothetical protein